MFTGGKVINLKKVEALGNMLVPTKSFRKFKC
jgi:hypothetical protein